MTMAADTHHAHAAPPAPRGIHRWTAAGWLRVLWVTPLGFGFGLVRGVVVHRRSVGRAVTMSRAGSVLAARLGARSGTLDTGVRTGTTVEGVVVRTTDEHIVARAALERVHQPGRDVTRGLPNDGLGGRARFGALRLWLL